MFAGRGKAPTGECWIALTAVHFLGEALDSLYPGLGKQRGLDAAQVERQAASQEGMPQGSFEDTSAVTTNL